MEKTAQHLQDAEPTSTAAGDAQPVVTPANTGAEQSKSEQPPKDPKLTAIAPDSGKKKRTAGLWAFDVLLYPVVSNFVVFAISVYFTFLTSYGGTRRTNDGELLKNYTKIEQNGKTLLENTAADGTKTLHNLEDTKLIYGKFGNWMNKRGIYVNDQLVKMGMTPKAADMTKMVAFSFIDGSLVAPLVKLVEDRREKISHGLDKMLGTEPEDKSVYAAEPKQSWGSVLTGRLATVSIVVPTAVALGNLGTRDGKLAWSSGKKDDGFVSLNDRFFNNPGRETGEWIEATKPSLTQWLSKYVVDIPYLFKTIYFEAFYTSVCTGGLYVSSRSIAGLDKKKSNPQPESYETALPAKHSVRLSPEAVEKVDAAIERKFGSETLKTATPTAAPEQFSERSRAEAGQDKFASV